MTELLQHIEQFHFLRPWWLLALAPAMILLILLWRRRAAYGNWQGVISPNLLPHLLTGDQNRHSRWPLSLLLLCWILAVVAMAGPTWQRLPQALKQKVDARVIVLDMSLSMYATDLAPSRMIRARLKLTDILQQSSEGLSALVVYAGTPHVVTPLTDDTNTILSMVNSLSPDIMPVKGSDPVAAVEKALEVLDQAGLSQGRILLMTDELPKGFAEQVEPMLSFRTPLSIMGIGTREGAPIHLPDGSFVKRADGSIVIPKLNVSAMKSTARELNARFSTISSDDADIEYLLAGNLLPDQQELADSRREFDVWEEAGHWLVLIMLPFAAAAYRKGWFGALLLPLLTGLTLVATPRPAQAFDWQDLWQTPDQQGRAQLEAGNPERAAELFEDPQWKAASQYRADNYEAAQQGFAQGGDADSFYNLGNALARQQQLDAAIEAYDKALALKPDMEDARFNRELVEKLKQQQQQQSQQGENSESQDQQSDADKPSPDDPSQQDKDDSGEQNQDSQNRPQDSQSTPDSEQAQEDNDQPDQGQETQNQDQEQQHAGQPDQQQSEEASQQEAPPQPEQDPMSVPGKPRTEDQQAMEQWLRRVPDDPGGLLRRKFEYESQLRENRSAGENPW
ncbi:MAG: hypothetical protein CML06_15385 [Pseudomonadales bacterium]|nr:hypothetical protein [Pseudomonadales bacterium]